LTPRERILSIGGCNDGRPGDLGRRFGEIRTNLEPDDLEQAARETIDASRFLEKEVRVKNGPWYLMRIRPYKTWEGKLEGAVLSSQDIDNLKRMLDQARIFAEALIENAREPILVLDEGLRVALANLVFYKMFHALPEETQGRVIYELGNKQWDIPRLRELFRMINTRNTGIDDFEATHKFEYLGLRRMILNARRIEPPGGKQMILLSMEDVTPVNPEK